LQFGQASSSDNPQLLQAFQFSCTGDLHPGHLVGPIGFTFLQKGHTSESGGTRLLQ
jgi:hypothetical protein